MKSDLTPAKSRSHEYGGSKSSGFRPRNESRIEPGSRDVQNLLGHPAAMTDRPHCQLGVAYDRVRVEVHNLAGDAIPAKPFNSQRVRQMLAEAWHVPRNCGYPRLTNLDTLGLTSADRIPNLHFNYAFEM